MYLENMNAVNDRDMPLFITKIQENRTNSFGYTT